ncbi:MAG: DUF948 domain-containing protein [bacterium]
MTDTVLIIGLVIFSVLVGFIIFFIIDLRRTSTAVRELVRNTEEDLIPALNELKLTLQSIRAVTDDINTVTAEARDFADTIAHVTHSIKQVSGAIDTVSVNATATIAGLRAGLKEGVTALFTNLISRKEK